MAIKLMNTLDALPGRHIIVELGSSFAEAICPNMPRESLSRVAGAFAEVVEGKISFAHCREIVTEIIGRDDPVTRIEEILNLPDEPLPYVGDPDSEESGSSMRRRTRTWTGPEDLRLLGGVVRYGLDNWQAVAHYLGSGRNRAQCSQRWTRGLNPRISKKGWTAEEDVQLEELVKQYGTKSWAKIASIMGNRSDVQCRYHYRQLSGDQSSSEVPLAHKGKLSMSSHCMSPVVPPMNDAVSSHMSLAEGRTFQSSPLMLGGHSSGSTRLLIPLAPLTSRRHALMEVPVMTGVTPRWEVCGADPMALDSFLRHFQR